MRNLEEVDIRVGEPQPLGASVCGDGVNFALHSQDATRVVLELFDRPQDAMASRRIELDPSVNRTGDVWHICLKGIREGQLYALRVDGPYNPEAGHRFNVHKLLLDPFAKAVSKDPVWDFTVDLGYERLDNAAHQPKCVFVNGNFDWKDDRAPRHPWSKTVIYETHLRGLTVHSSANVKHPGTYRGLIEKIPYFQELGITTVELLPIFEFNEHQSRRFYPDTFLPVKNYWGYDPILFFAPKAAFAASEKLGGQIQEFKEMVSALHRADIEIILDVVFNHTAEGEELGPTLSWRGMDNATFYMLEDDKRFYKNFTGCGNTVNANHPFVQEFILSALRYWVKEMRVDGFRFDLASILSRDTRGQLMEKSPLVERIATDAVLKDVKLIAEPWDAVGRNPLGHFSTARWAEWNDRFRNDVRLFWRGDEGAIGNFATRICGSSDTFASSEKNPHNSINFVTCHDGFTLNDLVSYNAKHNHTNGQYNRDGTNENLSYNHGIEGQTEDAAIVSLRKRQMKNFLLTLFISRGVPMLNGGDEFCRTQQGNNNAYCQDNDISWYHWELLDGHKDIFNFTRALIALRRAHPVLSQGEFYTNQNIQWFSPQGQSPAWSVWEKQLGCLIHEDGGHYLYVMFNASDQKASFKLPSPPSQARWRVFVDTSTETPSLECQEVYEVASKTSVILLV